MPVVLAKRHILNSADHQDVSLTPRSSIYFEDPPRLSIKYF